MNKFRYTVKWRLFRRPLIVLQVQEIRQYAENTGGSIETWPVTVWRNATVADILPEFSNDRA